MITYLSMLSDGCCNDDSNYQVDQQRNRILAIEAMNNLKKSGTYKTYAT